jgi:UDP-glucose 4-epimerase
LFDELKEHEVCGVDLREPTQKSSAGSIAIADIRDTVAMTKACEGVNAVIHCAAQVSVQRSTADPAEDAQMNVIGTISMLQAAHRAGVKKFVFISSAAVYGDPQYSPVDEEHPRLPKSFYGTSKLAAEHYVQAHGYSFGTNWAIVRPFNFYSPRADPKSPYSGVITKFAESAKAGRPLIIEGDGEQTRDFLHATDVARMLRLTIESDVRNVIINCGSGRGTSINDLARTVIEASGKKINIERVAARTGDIRHSVAEASRAEKLIGFRTKVTLRDGLETFFSN